ncbi:MAG TPA: hypothetical protein VGX76_22365, partial [Pirellulales bacterium]|nr:hypothetical protein [Pirellulales bacterium]
MKKIPTPLAGSSPGNSRIQGASIVDDLGMVHKFLLDTLVSCAIAWHTLGTRRCGGFEIAHGRIR